MTTISIRTISCAAALLGLSACMHTGEAQLTVQGPGLVRSNPQGILCDASGGDGCSAQLGDSFTLSAQPSSGAHFDHWEGDELCKDSKLSTLVIGRAPERELVCTAVFAEGEVGGGGETP